MGSNHNASLDRGYSWVRSWGRRPIIMHHLMHSVCTDNCGRVCMTQSTQQYTSRDVHIFIRHPMIFIFIRMIFIFLFFPWKLTKYGKWSPRYKNLTFHDSIAVAGISQNGARKAGLRAEKVGLCPTLWTKLLIKNKAIHWMQMILHARRSPTRRLRALL